MGMHLSGVVGLVACLEAATAVALRKVLPPPIQFLLWNLTATATIISISATDQLAPHSTWILGKRRRDGRILPRGWLLWAYHAGIRIKLRLQRMITNENVYDGIFEKMYLGGWPSNAREAPQVDKLAVVDVTCELPLKIAAKAYLMVPVWDTHSMLLNVLVLLLVGFNEMMIVRIMPMVIVCYKTGVYGEYGHV